MTVRLGPIVRRHRQARRLTIDELAAAAGVSANYLGRVELDQSTPTVAVVALLERALGLRPGRLMADAARDDHAEALTA